MKNSNAIILLSGGLDSATAAAIARDSGFKLYGITFYYGQRHSVELECAKRVATSLKFEDHIFIDIPSDVFVSALVKGSGRDVPKGRDISTGEIPDTYVPARNIIFLSYALAFAESIGSTDIFIGANAVDYSGYPDCRPEFFRAFSDMAKAGTKTGAQGGFFSIHTPLLMMKKSEIIIAGTRLGVDYSLTHSCYDPDDDGSSCGECDSCIIRKRGFIDADVPDPTKYRRNG